MARAGATERRRSLVDVLNRGSACSLHDHRNFRQPCPCAGNPPRCGARARTPGAGSGLPPTASGQAVPAPCRPVASPARCSPDGWRRPGSGRSSRPRPADPWQSVLDGVVLRRACPAALPTPIVDKSQARALPVVTRCSANRHYGRMSRCAERETPMWDVFLRRWLDMLLWWVPRKKETPPGAGQARRERAPEPASRSAEPGARAARSQPAQRQAQAKSGAPRPAEPRARLSPKPAPVKPEKPVAAPVPDDLTEIKGIGPAMQNKLRALGITTFADLAAADPDPERAQGLAALVPGPGPPWTEAARQRART